MSRVGLEGQVAVVTGAARGVGELLARKLSARDVMSAHLRQIERLNRNVNAVVAKLDDAKCLALAEEADRRPRVGDLTYGHRKRVS